MAAEQTKNKKTETENKTKEEKLRELGLKLKSLREAQQLTLDNAWKATKIQKKHLMHIESGELDKLPKGPFCRSFVKQYCDYLNAHDFWEKYDSLTKEPDRLPKLETSAEQEAVCATRPAIFRSASHLWIYLLIIISLGSAAWITWNYRGEISLNSTTPLDGGTAPIAAEKLKEEAEKKAAAEKEAVTPAAPTSQEQQPSSVDLGWMDGKAPVAKTAVPAAVAISADAAAAASSDQPVAGGPSVLKIKSTGTIWIKVTRGAEKLKEGLLKEGESLEFSPSADTPLRVRYGNPVKTVISWAASPEAQVGTTAKPLTKYYWNDGTVTDSKNRSAN